MEFHGSYCPSLLLLQITRYIIIYSCWILHRSFHHQWTIIILQQIKDPFMNILLNSKTQTYCMLKLWEHSPDPALHKSVKILRLWLTDKLLTLESHRFKKKILNRYYIISEFLKFDNLDVIHQNETHFLLHIRSPPSFPSSGLRTVCIFLLHFGNMIHNSVRAGM